MYAKCTGGLAQIVRLEGKTSCNGVDGQRCDGVPPGLSFSFTPISPIPNQPLRKTGGKWSRDCSAEGVGGRARRGRGGGERPGGPGARPRNARRSGVVLAVLDDRPEERLVVGSLAQPVQDQFGHGHRIEG